MTRLRALPLLAVLLVLPVPAARAVAVRSAAYTFTGVAVEDCFGCGVTAGSFTGTFTGVVDGHAYVEAPLTMAYTANNSVGPTCVITAIASGTLHVEDPTAPLDTYFNWTRVDVRILAATAGAMNGVFAATYVPVDPLPFPCGSPARFDMRGTGYGT
jgi:hypothetical protein